jgi:hypothetical protein
MPDFLRPNFFHPSWRTAAPLALPQTQALQDLDRFNDAFPFRLELGDHLLDIHIASLTMENPHNYDLFRLFLLPGGLPRRFPVFIAVIHDGGRPLRFPRPKLIRSNTMIAALNPSCSARSSSIIFEMSIR